MTIFLKLSGILNTSLADAFVRGIRLVYANRKFFEFAADQVCYSPKNKKERSLTVLLCFMRETGLEPVQCELHAPQTCASASSATPAYSASDPGFLFPHLSA